VLGQFDGRDIVTASIKVTNAGDGLSQAMTIEPKQYHIGDVVTVVLECEVSSIDFKPIKDTDVLARVHTLRAGIATVVENSFAKDVLDKQRKKNDEAKGIQALPLDDDPNL
jgi:hypothetical protein